MKITDIATKFAFDMLAAELKEERDGAVIMEKVMQLSARYVVLAVTLAENKGMNKEEELKVFVDTYKEMINHIISQMESTIKEVKANESTIPISPVQFSNN